MADKLTIYRGALRIIGHAAGLQSLTEVSHARTELDNAWDKSVTSLIEEGLWNFSSRTVQLSNDEDADPIFGYSKAFSKPEDYVRIVAISSHEDFNVPFEEFDQDADYWYADIDPMYLKYVSNDASYGLNIGKWPQSFAETLEAKLAMEVARPLSAHKDDLANARTLYKLRLRRAKTLDAVDERVKQRPPGRLVRSRVTQRTRRD